MIKSTHRSIRKNIKLKIRSMSPLFLVDPLNIPKLLKTLLLNLYVYWRFVENKAKRKEKLNPNQVRFFLFLRETYILNQYFVVFYSMRCRKNMIISDDTIRRREETFRILSRVSHVTETWRWKLFQTNIAWFKGEYTMFCSTFVSTLKFWRF